MINPADLLMIIHFLWAAFMVVGLPLGLYLRSPALRWFHFIGMFLTAFFAAANIYCPLTVWEEMLRWEGESAVIHGGSFLARHLSAVLFPDLPPGILRAASVAWGTITLVAMVIVPPGQRRSSEPGAVHGC